jgi:hypothetical protein
MSTPTIGSSNLGALRFRGEVDEGEFPVSMAMLTGEDGTILVQADVATWDVVAFVVQRGTAPAYSLTGQLATLVIFNTPQTDGRWNVNPDGYNFRHRFDVTLISPALVGGDVLRLEYTFHAAGGASAYFAGLQQRIFEYTIKEVW